MKFSGMFFIRKARQSYEYCRRFPASPFSYAVSSRWPLFTNARVGDPEDIVMTQRQSLWCYPDDSSMPRKPFEAYASPAFLWPAAWVRERIPQSNNAASTTLPLGTTAKVTNL